jgi:hypothetical protein
MWDTREGRPPLLRFTVGRSHIGINAGYGFQISDQRLFSDAVMGSPLFGARTSSKLDGVIGGAQTGSQLASGIWLIGLEADIAATTPAGDQDLFLPWHRAAITVNGFDAPAGTWHMQTGLVLRCADGRRDGAGRPGRPEVRLLPGFHMWARSSGRASPAPR